MKTSLLKTIKLSVLIGLVSLSPKAFASQVEWDFCLSPYMGGGESLTGSILANSADFTLTQNQNGDSFRNFTYDNPNATGFFTYAGSDGSTLTHSFTGIAATIDYAPGDTVFSLQSDDSSFFIATLNFHEQITDSSFDTLLGAGSAGYSHAELSFSANDTTQNLFDNIDFSQNVSGLSRILGGSPQNVASVPEPSSLVLLALGGLGAFFFRRRQ